MKRKLIFSVIAFASAFMVQAQTADEILSKYFENTGGLDKWKAVQGMKMIAKVNQGGMEIPLEIVNMKDGRQFTKATFQGKEIMQGVYDGKTLWSHNFMNMKAEKGDAEETENFKQEIGTFPTPFLNYKELGFKVELLGKESVEGSEAFKIKLTKKPIKIDGVETENVVFYYFDAENFVPLMLEAEIKEGPAKGLISQVKFSDYQEVNGLMIAFSRAQGVKDKGNAPLTITSVEINPKVDDKLFTYPEGN